MSRTIVSTKKNAEPMGTTKITIHIAGVIRELDLFLEKWYDLSETLRRLHDERTAQVVENAEDLLSEYGAPCITRTFGNCNPGHIFIYANLYNDCAQPFVREFNELLAKMQ